MADPPAGSPQEAKHDINDSLRLASILHSVSAISRQISPLPGCHGIDSIQSDTFDLHCLHPMVSPPPPGAPPAPVAPGPVPAPRARRPTAPPRPAPRTPPQTGTKFIAVCDPGEKGAEGLLQGLHQLYGDFVMKEPFYVLDMPIKVEAFDENVVATVRAFNSAS